MAIEPQPRNAWYRSKIALTLLACSTVAGLFLLAAYPTQVFGALPLLLVLACPLMHLFMHRRHRRHAENQRPPREPTLL